MERRPHAPARPLRSVRRPPQYSDTFQTPRDCIGTFTVIDHHFRRRTYQDGLFNSRRWCIQQSSKHALYLILFHPELYHALLAAVPDGRALPNPHHSVWERFLHDNPDTLRAFATERGYTIYDHSY